MYCLSQSAGASTMWIGLTRACSSTAPTSASSFKWLDGTSPTYSNWAYTEPNNIIVSGLQEPCVVMSPSSYTWSDVRCVATMQIVACQYRLSMRKNDNVL